MRVSTIVTLLIGLVGGRAAHEHLEHLGSWFLTSAVSDPPRCN